MKSQLPRLVAAALRPIKACNPPLACEWFEAKGDADGR